MATTKRPTEKIVVPSAPELKLASELLKKGSPVGGRIMAEAAAAKKEQETKKANPANVPPKRGTTKGPTKGPRK